MQRWKWSCFVISPIGSPGGPVRRRSDRVFSEIIVPALTSCGYESIRADLLDDPGQITHQMIQHLVNDTLIIADLTGANANVFYELAIRHATRRPTITIAESGEHIPFDVAAFRVLMMNSNESTGVSVARDALQKRVELVERHSESEDSPLATALPAWRFCIPRREVPLDLVDSLILSYLHLSFTMGWREHLPEDRRCEEARLLLGRLEAQLHTLTDILGMLGPNEFYELEKAQWKAGRGEP